MKKGVFNVWLKELCSLVFTQTVQAFLLAIILSIVLSVFSDGTQSEASISAAGVISIIALASISKIELLVKKIFGIESQFGDPSMANGIKSVAGGILAAKSVGKIANNVPKMVTGYRETRGAKRDIARAQQRAARKMNLLKETMGADNDSATSVTNNSEVIDVNNNSNSSSNNGNNTIGGASDTSNTNNANNTSNTNNTNSASSNSDAIKAKRADAKYKERMLDIQEKYEDELAKAQKRKTEGRRKIVSGVSESIGAVGGAAAGFAVGAGSGDISRGIAFGIGAGDTIGKNAVSAGYYMKDMKSDRKSIRKADRDAINEMRKLVENEENVIKETRDARTAKERRAIRKEKREISRQIEKKFDSIMDAGKL